MNAGEFLWYGWTGLYAFGVLFGLGWLLRDELRGRLKRRQSGARLPEPANDNERNRNRLRKRIAPFGKDVSDRRGVSRLVGSAVTPYVIVYKVTR
jgi:hypothetical protein